MNIFIQEMNMRMRRNQSSPRVGSSHNASPAMSSNCPSVEPPITENGAEPEDLEVRVMVMIDRRMQVQWINESFEEQEKQNKMYQSDNLKLLFYKGADGSGSPVVGREMNTV